MKKYISDKRLEKILETSMVDDMDSEELLMTIIMYECKELPQEQWQTIEEFKANPVDGWYWINYDNVVYMSYYKLNIFFENDHAVDSSILESDCITHVMPIKTPEAPK